MQKSENSSFILYVALEASEVSKSMHTKILLSRLLLASKIADEAELARRSPMLPPIGLRAFFAFAF